MLRSEIFSARLLLVYVLLLLPMLASISAIDKEHAAENNGQGVLFTMMKDWPNATAELEVPSKDSLSFVAMRPDCINKTSLGQIFKFSCAKCWINLEWQSENARVHNMKPSVGANKQLSVSLKNSDGSYTGSWEDGKGDEKEFTLPCPVANEKIGDSERYKVQFTMLRDKSSASNDCDVRLQFGTNYSVYATTTTPPPPKLIAMTPETKSSGFFSKYGLYVYIFGGIVGVALLVGLVALCCCLVKRNRNKNKVTNEEVGLGRKLPTTEPMSGASMKGTTQEQQSDELKVVVKKPKRPSGSEQVESSQPLREVSAISSTPPGLDSYMDLPEDLRQRMHRRKAKEMYLRHLDRYDVQPVDDIRSRGTEEIAKSAEGKNMMETAKESETCMLQRHKKKQAQLAALRTKTPMKTGEKTKQAPTHATAVTPMTKTNRSKKTTEGKLVGPKTDGTQQQTSKNTEDTQQNSSSEEESSSATGTQR